MEGPTITPMMPTSTAATAAQKVHRAYRRIRASRSLPVATPHPSARFLHALPEDGRVGVPLADWSFLRPNVVCGCAFPLVRRSSVTSSTLGSWVIGSRANAGFRRRQCLSTQSLNYCGHGRRGNSIAKDLDLCSIFVIDAKDRAAADAFTRSDPYHVNRMWETVQTSFHAPICPKSAITLSRKDWHSSANRAVV